MHRPQNYHHRQNSADLGSFDEHDDEAGGVVITTKTTKVMDSLGRTRSITTETIKTLPDGSNIIETKTTNISRPTSRSNSLRSNSLRNNSLNHGINANYNLDKIEEDLHDFDYTYLDHDDRQSPPPILNQESHQQSPRTQKYIQEQRNALALEFPLPLKPEERTASFSSNQSSPKRLKSILKNGSSQILPLQDGREEGASIHDVIALNGNSFSPIKSAAIDVPQQTSVASGGASIKFRETVETISYPAEAHNLAELLREEEFKKDQEKQKNVDMYSQAMKVAMQKVYGKKEGNNTALHTPPQSPLTESRKDLDALAEKKLKKDQKRGKVESGGISKNYVYENHHRDFSIRSLRSGPVAEDGHISTRKERAKEEKRHLKEEDKRNAELLKNAEKERKKEEKLQKKKEKKPFSFFGIKKQKEGTTGATADDSLVSEQAPSPVAPNVLNLDGNARDAHVSSEMTPAVQSPSSPQRQAYLIPRQEAIIDSQEEAQLPEDSSIAERSSLFVDVPEIADDVEENTRVEVIEQKVRPTSEITTDANVPPRGDIAEIQHEDPEVPPRADLQLLNSTDVQVIPIAEEHLPTLVSGNNNHPQVLVDETIDDAGILGGAKANSGPLPTVSTTEEPKSAVMEDAFESLVGEDFESEHAPDKIAKPELQPLDEMPSVGQLSDFLAEEQAFSSGSSNISPEKVSNEISNESPDNSFEPERLRNLITETHTAIGGGFRESAASEESERTLRSDPVVFKVPHKPQVLHTGQEEAVDASADPGRKHMESAGPESSPGAPLVTTSGKTTSPLEANELESREESFGGQTDPAMYSQQEGSLGSPIQLTLVTQDKTKSGQGPTTSEDETKKSTKKRTHRFKKMIDKYFINNYSK